MHAFCSHLRYFAGWDWLNFELRHTFRAILVVFCEVILNSNKLLNIKNLFLQTFLLLPLLATRGYSSSFKLSLPPELLQVIPTLPLEQRSRSCSVRTGYVPRPVQSEPVLSTLPRCLVLLCSNLAHRLRRHKTRQSRAGSCRC